MLPSEMTFGGPGVLFILQQKKTASHSLVKQFFADLIIQGYYLYFHYDGKNHWFSFCFAVQIL